MLLTFFVAIALYIYRNFILYFVSYKDNDFSKITDPYRKVYLMVLDLSSL